VRVVAAVPKIEVRVYLGEGGGASLEAFKAAGGG
jgi:hypothetical protein